MTALSTDDIALIRRCIEWRRANGWTITPHDRGYVEWNRDGWMVDCYADGAAQITVEDPKRRLGYWFPTSVVQAVDVLVAVGILPAVFSSAYRAGREAASDAIGRMPLSLGDEGWGRMADLAEAAGYPRRLVMDRRRRDDMTTVTIESAYQYGYRRAAEVAR